MKQSPTEPTIHAQHSPAAIGAEPMEAAVEGTDNALDERHGPPVDGAELLDDIELFAGRFLALPTQHHLVVLSLWIAHTWAVNAFYVTPRLVLSSPEPGSGKTRVLEILQLLCSNAKITVSITTPALFRRIEADKTPPTILQDECDAVFGQARNSHSEDLRAVFNAGYKRGATIDRCERESGHIAVKEFPVFAPVALAGLIFGSVTKHMRTVLDRAVVFHMQKRAPGERLDEFRSRDAESMAAPMRKRLRAWAADHFDALADSRPKIPDGVWDRRAECWEALLAIADAAGRDWPERAREACCHFEYNVDLDDDQLSVGVRLLRDIRQEFGDRDRMHSADLVGALTSDPASEWAHLSGKTLDQSGLAQELRRYGVETRDVRLNGSVRKGYTIAGATGLGQAWQRWLPAPKVGNKRDIGDTADQDVAEGSAQTHQRNGAATDRKPSGQESSDDVADVAHVAAHQKYSRGRVAQHVGAESVRPTAGSQTIGDRFARLEEKLQHDSADVKEEKTGADQPGEPKGDVCPRCGSKLGSSTGKCVQCIVERASALA